MGALRHTARLVRAARALARADALIPPEALRALPRSVRTLLRLARFGRRGHATGVLANVFEALGPSYIKLGQFLATRPDVIGAERARDLEMLQDRLPPFAEEEAKDAVAEGLGAPVAELFPDFGPPVAAASIAQVHKAGAYAVKILRPGIEARFASDLETFLWLARLMERHSVEARRHRPVAAIEMLAEGVRLEMDLRLEAAAISEMAANTREDDGFRTPEVDWLRTARRVLTISWVDGIPIAKQDALVAAGHDLSALGQRLIRLFLTHALRDGFFHADMHPGNLFVGADGAIIAVDFGIMGRLSEETRAVLGEILNGFLTRDYLGVARAHVRAGYVPEDVSEAAFAQALRAIGEPILGRSAPDISMGRLLVQLFEVAQQFQMRTQPQLILLQKTMVSVEGLARRFDPNLNIWDAARPVIEDWMIARAAPQARLDELTRDARAFAQGVARLPDALGALERLALRETLREAPPPAQGKGWRPPVRFFLGAVIGALLGAGGVFAWFMMR